MTLDTDTHIKLRQATTPTDLEIVKDLILEAGLSQNRQDITATLDNSTYWIADLDGVPSGCIGLEHGNHVSLIRSAVVMPESRSKGLGRALVRSALTQASLRGDQMVYLFSTGSGDYWQRFGFERIDSAELTAALPDSPQVKGGIQRGWIMKEMAWKLKVNRSNS